MATAVLDKIPKVEVAGLQFSAAAKGLVAAGLGDAAALLINRYAGAGRSANELRMLGVVSRLGAAFLLHQKQVKGLLGSDAANIGSLLLVADAIRSVWDVRAKVGFEVAKFLPSQTASATNTTPAQMAADVGGAEIVWG